MARKCSHRGNKGHNARIWTDPGSLAGGVGLKLFGVQLLIMASPPMEKSSSMDCLSAPFLASSSSSPSSSSNRLVSIDETPEKYVMAIFPMISWGKH